MRHRRKKQSVWKILGYLLIIGGLVASSVVLFAKTQQVQQILQQSNEQLNTLSASKTNLETNITQLQQRKDQVEQQLQELQQAIEELKKANPELTLQLGNKQPKYAYLTFDDGPSKNTVKILDFLKANNIKATFFVIGKKGEEEIYKRIVDEGHTLAVHSNTHKYDAIYRNVDTFMKDINDLSAMLEQVTGVKPTIMRFPGGSNNTVSHKYGGQTIMDKIIPTVENAGYTYFDWNVDSQDASKARQDKNVIVNSVLNGAKYTDNAVILMHDAAIKTTTVEALPQIVEGLRRQGFIFKELTPESEHITFK